MFLILLILGSCPMLHRFDY